MPRSPSPKVCQRKARLLQSCSELAMEPSVNLTAAGRMGSHRAPLPTRGKHPHAAREWSSGYSLSDLSKDHGSVGLWCLHQGLSERSGGTRAFAECCEVLCLWLHPCFLQMGLVFGGLCRAFLGLWLPRPPWCLSLLKELFVHGHLGKEWQLECPRKCLPASSSPLGG